MTFHKPVYIGNALILSARLNYVRRSSMEVEVTIESENFDDGTRVRTGTTFVTMVPLDGNGRPTEVPRWCLKQRKTEGTSGTERRGSRSA
jgi:acyl-CoA hydrolase